MNSNSHELFQELGEESVIWDAGHWIEKKKSNRSQDD